MRRVEPSDFADRDYMDRLARDLSARHYAREEDKWRAKARLFRALGHEVIATGAEVFAAQMHRAFVAEVTDPRPEA